MARVLAAAATLLVFFAPFFLSGFDRLTGDSGDNRFILVLLEHWFHVFSLQRPDPLSPPFFWPQSGVLRYSESLLLFALPYTPLRALGLDEFWAFQTSLIAVRLAGFASMYLFLSKTLRLSSNWALFGSALSVLASVNFITQGHAQLSVAGLLPLLAFFLARYWTTRQRRTWLAYAWLAAAALLFASIALTSFYVAFFAALTFPLAIAAYATLRSLIDPAPARNLLQLLPEFIADGIVAALLLAAALAPFFSIYLPQFLLTKGRPFEITLPNMRPPWELLNVSRDNLLWGWLMNASLGTWSYPLNGYGWPPFTVLLLAAATLFLIRRHLQRRAEPRDSAALALILTLILLGLATTTIPVWRYLHHHLPGANAIRVTQRITVVLHLGAAATAALFLARIPRFALPLAALLLLEQFNFSTYPGFSRRGYQWTQARLAHSRPPACQAFFLARYSGVNEERILDAMLLAERLQIPTLEGYSGFAPTGWPTDLNLPDRDQLITAWAKPRARNRQICSLDYESARWTLIP
jgi:hypothetical protein